MKRPHHLFTLLTGPFLVSTLVVGACGSEDGEVDTSGSVSGPSSDDDSSGTDSTAADSDASATDDSATASASATDSDTDSSSATDTNSSSGIVQEDMGGGGCGTMCDIWTPGDCPEGEKCTAVACEVGSFSWDSNVCRPIGGDKAPGDECEGAYGIDGIDDCGEGMMCYNANSVSGLGNCVEFCIGSVDAPQCASSEALCAVWNNGVLPLCLTTCDPLSIDCPNPEALCLPSPNGDGFQCVVNASGDMGEYGMPCPFSNNCNQGLICIQAEGVPDAACDGSAWCCSPVCDTGDANNCPGAGQECVEWYDSSGGSVPPGYETTGVCAVPAP